LIADINDTRSALAALNPPANLPVGNSEAGAYYNTLVMQAMDFGVRVSFLISCLCSTNLMTLLQMANVHPWFGHVSIADAATWTWDFFQQTDVAAATVLPNNPQMYIAETGWPSVMPYLFVECFVVEADLNARLRMMQHPCLTDRPLHRKPISR
jgi:hypothetical protein